MKRFFLFIFQSYEASGGVRDLKGHFDTFEEAKAQADAHQEAKRAYMRTYLREQGRTSEIERFIDSIDILDTQTGIVVWSTYPKWFEEKPL